MNISNDILFYIFQYLKSPRYLATFSLVCKEWYSIATQPYFYQNIIIYNPKQLYSFIHTAYNTSHHGNNIGYYVKHLIILFSDPISTNTMSQLQLSCPNLLTIYYNLDSSVSFNHDNLNNNRYRYELIGYWKKLTQLPSWYKEDRFTIILSNHSTLTRFILHPTLNDLNDILKSNPINGLHLFKSSSAQLKELCLDFSQYYLPFNMNLDYLNIIHQCCPTIDKLTIINALLYCTKENNNNYNIQNKTKKMIQQESQINYLCFENISIDNPSFFNYITKKYPLLTSLLLYNITFIENQQSHEDYQSVIKNMITIELPNLNELGVTIANNAYRYWPNDDLLSWLHDHPNQIKYMHWPFTIYPTTITYDNDSVIDIDNTIDKNIIMKKSKLNNQKEKEDEQQQQIQLQKSYNYFPIYQNRPNIEFINHLSTLTLKLSGDNTEMTLDYLLHCNHGMISKSITTLTIEPLDWNHHINDHKSTFYIYNWLEALPALKRLYLHHMDVCLHERFSISYPEKNILTRQSSSSSTHFLEELTLFQCSIKSMNGFTLLCQQCPKLTILENYNCEFFVNEKEIKKYQSQPYYAIIYVPHSSFHKLTFQGWIKMDQECMESISNYDLFVKMIPFSATITTPSSSSSSYKNNKCNYNNNDIASQSYYFNSYHLDSKKKPLINILARSIDVLNFGGNFLIH